MKGIVQDLRFGARQLRKNPGLTLAAVLCIALGIGANSATFSVARAFLWPSSRVAQPEELVRMFVRWSSGLNYGSFSYLDYLDVRDRNDVFAGVIANTIMPFHVSAGDRNERIWGAAVSGNYFSVMGLKMSSGRDFLAGEDQLGAARPVAIISHGLWRRRFGSDPAVTGKTIFINARPFTIIGVGPADFYGTNTGLGQDLWIPITMVDQMGDSRRDLKSRGNHWIQSVVGRRKPGVSYEQARASITALMAHLAEEYPDTNKGTSAQIYRESEASLHPSVRNGFVMFVRLMFGVVGLILILSCANVAGLLLARSAARRKEIAIRLALGADRRRLIRQLLAESLLMSLLAGAVGLVLGVWLTQIIQSVSLPTGLPLKIDIHLDWSVLGFTFAVTLAAGVLFGLTPAFSITKTDLVSVLKEGNPVQLAGASRTRKALVVGQVALSLTLLIGAALVVRSLQNARNLDPGFNPENQVVAALDLGLQQYDESKGRQFVSMLRGRLKGTPGVTNVGFADNLPLSLSSSQTSARPEGYTPPPDGTNPNIDYLTVDYGYFAAMGIPILRGRAFAESDDRDAPPVILINETFARRFWPGQDPVGKHVRLRGREQTVIGMTANGKYFSLGEDPKAFMYLPLEQNHSSSVFVHVRTGVDPELFIQTLRREIQALDGKLPVSDVRTMHEALGFALLPARMAAGVVSAFAFLALFLAAVGLYGVMAYSVSQSARDIGIRMALGAQAKDVLSLVVRGGMLLTATGLALGLGIGLLLTRLIGGILYDISPTDPFSYAAAVLLLAAVALLAVFLPARKATRVDPMVALRE